jgi:hypothetical protein
MTKRDFFRLIIKIFGLYSIITTLFSALPNNISWAIWQIDLAGILWIIGTVTVVVLLFILLIYKSDKIILWLKLDKGFDNDNIDFQNFNTENILKLAVIIIGGIVLLKNIPVFLSHTIFAFKSSFHTDLHNDQIIKYGELKDYIFWFTSFLNIVIGYLMLTNYTYISRILKRKNDKNENINVA